MTDTGADALNAIRERRAAISPTPWQACHEGECICGQVWSIPHDLIVSMPPSIEEADRVPSDDKIKANAKFIAHAPADIDTLLAIIDAQAAEITGYRSDLAACEERYDQLAKAVDDAVERGASADREA